MKIITFSTTDNERLEYFRRFGVEMGMQSRSLLVRELYWRFPASLSGPDLKTLGQLCQYTLARYHARTGNKILEAIFKVRTYLSCYYLAAVTRRVLENEKPDIIAVYNGYSATVSTIVWVARSMHIEVACFENGLLPNTTTCDGRGINYFNSMPREKDFYLNLKPTAAAEVRTDLVTRKPKKGKATGDAVAIPEKFIFVPFQVDTDSQILVNSPWIKDMRQLFDLIQALSESTAARNWVFVLKEHPSSSRTYSDLQSSDRIIFANHNNTQVLIEKSEAIITINSSVGIEGLLFGKRVITLGNAFYNIDGIVRNAASLDQLEHIVASIPQWRPDLQTIGKFLDYLKNCYLIPDSYRSPTERHWLALKVRLDSIAQAS